MENILEKIRRKDIQDIFECLSQAANEDRQEADNYLKLRTDVSGPFLVWDLTYRNLMNRFDEDDVIKHAIANRGM